MRPILIVATLACLALVLWHALVVTAPGVQTGIDRRAEVEIAPLATHPLDVIARGRMVRVTGLADSAAARDAIVARLAALPGVAGVEDRIEILPLGAPYRFAASRRADRQVGVEGDAPSRAAEVRILDAARGLATGGSLQSGLRLAAGAPGEGWTDSVARGIGALGFLTEGRIGIEGTSGRIDGIAPDGAAREAAVALLGADPLVLWQAGIELPLPLAERYRFSAERHADGVIRYEGHAPDEGTRELFTGALAALGPEVEGEIALARGMPARDWPRRVLDGIAALGSLSEGRFEIAGADARLSGTAATPEAASAAARHAGTLIVVAVEVEDLTPAARLEIGIEDGEPRLLDARLPEGLDARALGRALPELPREGSAVATGGRGDARLWQDALAALAIALPRLESGRVLVEETRLAIEGRLREGFSAAGTRAALRAAAGWAWSVSLGLDEAPVAAALTITKGDDGVALGGILPEGLPPETALVRFGGARSEGVTAGGAGDPAEWRRAIDAMTAILPAYDRLEARIATGSVTADGVLMPGQSLDALGGFLASRLGDGWDVALSGGERPAAEGATRIDVATGGTERLVAGHWLPVIEVEPTRAGCERAIDRHVPEGAIRFVAGGAALDAESQEAIDAVAAIAATCTGEGGLRLAVGGHTDDRGEPKANLALSARRAEAVEQALVAHGVDEDAIETAGHGSAMPVADNATAEGRARNRRITFEWLAPRQDRGASPPAPDPGGGPRSAILPGSRSDQTETPQ